MNWRILAVFCIAHYIWAMLEGRNWRLATKVVARNAIMTAAVAIDPGEWAWRLMAGTRFRN